AALAVDPLSSSGLRHALDLARPAADAVLGLAEGATAPAEEYCRRVGQAFTEHLHRRRDVHAAVIRFVGHPFWARRSAPPP
ncbi:hypothetical protein, partial [Saccharothrix hoggarensis]